MTLLSDRYRSLAIKGFVGIGLAVAGGATGYVMADVVSLDLLPWADAVAVFMAVVLLTMALSTAVVLALKPGRAPRGWGLLQVIVLALAAILFLVPMYGAGFVSPEWVFGAVVALLGIQSVANLMLWRRADEMLRRVMSETSALAFWASQTSLFVYAAAERLGLVGPVNAWGLIGLMMGVYLVASSVAAARRGIA